MKKKILAVFAHPDDETFGPGGTLAKYASKGVSVHLLTATKGEMGKSNLKPGMDASNLGEIRKNELVTAASILGIEKVDFLGFKDGELRQNIYHDLGKKIIEKIIEFDPQVVITYEPRGISGHLDHVAISFITTWAFLQARKIKAEQVKAGKLSNEVKAGKLSNEVKAGKLSNEVKAGKLYYYCLPEKLTAKRGQDYFVYFPQGYKDSEITTYIDIGDFKDIKIKAIKAHKSQIKDVKRLEKMQDQIGEETFILKYSNFSSVSLPEKDLFAGLK
jgi:LmbE family N-acetylglucosaminyl deacetylase